MNKNHLIVFNTIVMQAKTVITVVVSFLTSRYVLELLGVEGYGLYYLIAGVTATFEFLCSAMISTTSRYFTMAQAGEDLGHANTVFNTIRANNQRLIYIILLIIEVFGLIMLFWILRIPEGKMLTSIIIFHIMIIDTYYKLKVIPYNALLTAKENFLFINIVSVSQTVAKLAFVLALFIIPFDYRLIPYALAILAISFAARYITQRYVTKKYDEAYIDKNNVDLELKRDVFSFLKYSWVGQLSSIIRSQGTNFLLNVFTGTVSINAAYGVSKRVTGVTDMAFTPISATIVPQTLKSYSEKNYSRFEKLTLFNSKLGIILSWMVIIPLFIEADFVLDVWLKEVPKHAALITRLVLTAEMIRQLYNGLSMSFLVTDKVKRIYVLQTIIQSIAFLSMIVVWMIDKSNVFVVFAVDIVATAVNLMVFLFYMKDYTGIKALKYITNVIVPSVGGILLMLLMLYLKGYICTNFITNLAFSIFIAFVVVIYFYLCLFSKSEKNDAKTIMGSFVKKIQKNKLKV